MKQSTIIRAYKSLRKLSSETLPLSVSCNLYRLKRQLQPAWDFQEEEETKLLMKYNPIDNRDGRLTFKTPEDRKAFSDRLEELAAMEVDDISFSPVSMPVLENVNISVDDIEALEGFVVFGSDGHE